MRHWTKHHTTVFLPDIMTNRTLFLDYHPDEKVDCVFHGIN